MNSLTLLLRNQGLTEPLSDPDAALERAVAVERTAARLGASIG